MSLFTGFGSSSWQPPMAEFGAIEGQCRIDYLIYCSHFSLQDHQLDFLTGTNMSQIISATNDKDKSDG